VRRPLALLVAALALVGAASALGYVRSRTSKSNTPLAWTSGCAFVTPDSGGTPDVPLPKVLEVIAVSADTWSNTGCSYLTLHVDDPPEAGGEASLGRPVGKNYVVFRGDTWCPPDPKEPCYDSNATALTTVFYVDKPGDPDDGRILDADVEINNINFAFTTDGTRPPTAGTRPVADLENTLTHEFGHLLGLDHTCYDGWNPCEQGTCKVNHVSCQTELDCYPLDDTGRRIPSCSDSLPPKVSEATMFNFASAGDTTKRSLTQDDIEGICAIYPLAADPNVCARVSTGEDDGCAVGGRPGVGAGLAALAALALALRRRRA
jgi:hypothetical protein